MNAFYCQKHRSTVQAESGNCYVCEQNARYRKEREQHVSELLANPPQYLYTTWGWEQTNTTFYKVTRKTEKCLFGVEVEGRLVNGEEGFMTGHEEPTDEAKGEEVRLNLSKLNRYTEPVAVSWQARYERLLATAARAASE